MHAILNRVQVRPGAREEGERRWREMVLPALRKQPGFKGLVVGIDPESNRGMSLMLFDTEQNAGAAMTSPDLAVLRESAMTQLVGDIERSTYEVFLTEQA